MSLEALGDSTHHVTFKTVNWIETLDSASKRYLTSEIDGARAALIEVEGLLRRTDIRIPQRAFALALTLAKRSEIEAHLGASEAARSLFDEALRLFQGDPLGVRAGLTTREAVQMFIRHEERMGVQWRRGHIHNSGTVA